MISEVVKWGEFIKLSHTVFALPFAVASMVVAARDTRGWPGWRLFLLIVGAVLTARMCAMSFNRIVDRHFDKQNPRTANRHLPEGKISVGGAWFFCLASGIAFRGHLLPYQSDLFHPVAGSVGGGVLLFTDKTIYGFHAFIPGNRAGARAVGSVAGGPWDAPSRAYSSGPGGGPLADWIRCDLCAAGL